ncbi:hypothetical protein RRG08_013295 [Elysia crispata]|uniref:Uncharacterized protein n=1 Tax=Elysia crispata TaxID=231223 RepID=A0AAE1E6P2_9GAST|nr:hypothetical protein RRG08_013295 [Elysia crispata]
MLAADTKSLRGGQPKPIPKKSGLASKEHGAKSLSMSAFFPVVSISSRSAAAAAEAMVINSGPYYVQSPP